MWVPDKNKTGGFSVYDEKDQEIKRYDASKITYEFSFSERLDNIYKIKNEKIAVGEKHGILQSDLLSERGYTLELEGRLLDKIWDEA